MQHGQEEIQTWTQDLNQESFVGGAGHDDFTKFLELGNDSTQFDSVEQQNDLSGLDTPMGCLTFSQDGHAPALTPDQQAMLQNLQMNMGAMPRHASFPHLQQQQPIQAQQHQQYHTYQQMHNPYQRQVPLTPVSAEIHAGKYASAIDPTCQIVFYRQGASFTPLVSPAQTPIEKPWGMSDHVVADDFFSRFTSPTMEALQNFISTNTLFPPIDLNSEQPSPG